MGRSSRRGQTDRFVVQAGRLTYEWLDAWAQMPDSESSRHGWAHTWLAFASDGRLLTGDSAEPRVLAFEPDGSPAGSFAVPVTEVHGLTVLRVGGLELVWIADNGRKRRPAQNYAMQQAPGGGQVVAVDLRGRVVERLAKPQLRIYEDNFYAPTATAADETTGDLWVADGYGQSMVHKFDRSGRYVGSLSGDEPGAAGRFNTPHSVFIDRRKRDPELYVADRGNRRLQVYDMDGNFKRAFGDDFLTGPCCLALDEDRLLVAEFIDARVTVLDLDDQVVGFLGENKGAHDRDDWPNSKLADGSIVPNDHLAPGKFVSAHSIAVDGDGNIFVTEFLIGGRLTTLSRVSP